MDIDEEIEEWQTRVNESKQYEHHPDGAFLYEYAARRLAHLQRQKQFEIL